MSNKSEDRHLFIQNSLSLLETEGAIEGWSYEDAAQRYLVRLTDPVLVTYGKPPSGVLVLTLMSAESFLVGARVAPRSRVPDFVVAADGAVEPT